LRLYKKAVSPSEAVIRSQGGIAVVIRNSGFIKAVLAKNAVERKVRDFEGAHVRCPFYSVSHFGPVATWTNKFYNLTVTSGRRVLLAADEV